MLISTFKELFLGNKQLFEGLLIAQSDYDWAKYPVISLDLSALVTSSAQELKVSLSNRIDKIARGYSIEVGSGTTIEDKLSDLLDGLHQHYGKVVVLIDEYDYPLLRHIDNPIIAHAVLEVLKSFFIVVKSLSGKFKFIFVTGVTKFSKTSLFSGLNNLIDITMDPQYSTLLGYTQAELEYYFAENIDTIAYQQDQPQSALQKTIRSWYNGYQFSEKALKVYNPFSVLFFFNSGHFDNYWFNTGTPSFLIELIKRYKYPIQDLQGAQLNELEMNTFEIDELPIVPICFQTGYLTIEAYNPDTNNYVLDYPN